MIAFDTNLLVYAHRSENPWHRGAMTALLRVAEGRDPWAIPWPCVHEFHNIVTNGRIFKNPSPLPDALRFFQDLIQSRGLVFLGEAAKPVFHAVSRNTGFGATSCSVSFAAFSAAC